MSSATLQKLADLERRDRDRVISGADHHNWRLERVDPAEIEAFESKIGVVLPKEYRDHLIEAGSGAGPSYGLMSIAEVEEEWEGMCVDSLSDDLAAPDPSRPFPIPEDARFGGKSTWIEVEANAHGTIMIADQGCVTQIWLTTAGPWVGRVWELVWLGGWDGEARPAQVPRGLYSKGRPVAPDPPVLTMPPTFAEWFEAWLDYSILCLKASKNPIRRWASRFAS